MKYIKLYENYISESFTVMVYKNGKKHYRIPGIKSKKDAIDAAKRNEEGEFTGTKYKVEVIDPRGKVVYKN